MVIVYKMGLVTASVCAPADMPPEEVAASVTAQESGSWHISEDKTFRTGEPMPAPCDQLPETRKHWLLEC